jgi:hypothetical protein
MNICYVFSIDRVKSGELETRNIFADHFTKPLKGVAFYKFCSQVMNMDPGLTSADLGLAWDCAVSMSHSPQECVEDPSHHAKDDM